jgi:hypothetical protein
MQSPDTGPVAADISPEPAQIGILLVHGIGDQKPGETIAAFGEPMIDWLSQWLDGIGGDWRNHGVNADTLRGWLHARGCTGRSTSHDAHMAALRSLAADESPGLELTAHVFGPMSHECLVWRDFLTPMIEAARDKHNPHAAAAKDIPEIGEREGLPFLAARAHVIGAALQETDGDPAHARLRIESLRTDGAHQSEDWLFAEARWSQSFVQPSAKHVGLWSAFVSPYMIATLFVAHFQLALATLSRKRPDVWRGFGLLRLLSTIVLFPVIAPLTVLVQGLLLLLAVLTVIPLEIVQKRVAAVQRALSTLVGDSYTFLESASNRASIVAGVRERLAWLSTRCRHVVIVAHSQGAYVALETLHTLLPKRLRLLVTVGSGIERLSALRGIHSHRGLSLRMSIGIALVSSYLISVGAYQVLAGERRTWYLALLAVSALFYTLMFVLAGSDTDSHLHHGWYDLLKFHEIRWLDYFTAHDPVPGSSSPSSAAACQELANMHSVLLDHTSYWENRDQFVPSIVHAIARAGDSHLHLNRLTKHDGLLLEFAARWRPYRIAWLRMGWWLVSVAALAVAARRAHDIGLWGAKLRDLAVRMAAEVGTTVPQWLTGLRDRDLGAALVVVTWALSFVAVYALWALWERRDAGLLVRRAVLIEISAIGLVHHFFLAVYVAALAAMLTVATQLFFDVRWPGGVLPLGLKWSTSSIPFAIFNAVFLIGIDRSMSRAFQAAVKRRKRTLINEDEAIQLSTTTYSEVHKHCRPANEPFDALAFDDAMYSPAPLFDQADVLRLKAEMDEIRERRSSRRRS